MVVTYCTLLPQGVHNGLHAGKAQCPGVLAAQQVPVSSLQAVSGVSKVTPNAHFEDKMSPFWGQNVHLGAASKDKLPSAVCLLVSLSG